MFSLTLWFSASPARPALLPGGPPPCLARPPPCLARPPTHPPYRHLQENYQPMLEELGFLQDSELNDGRLMLFQLPSLLPIAAQVRPCLLFACFAPAEGLLKTRPGLAPP